MNQQEQPDNIRFPYTRDRLVECGPGLIIELHRARPCHIAYAAKTAEHDSSGLYRFATGPYNAWAAEQVALGRRENELTFDEFVHAIGALRP